MILCVNGFLLSFYTNFSQVCLHTLLSKFIIRKKIFASSLLTDIIFSFIRMFYSSPYESYKRGGKKRHNTWPHYIINNIDISLYIHRKKITTKTYRKKYTQHETTKIICLIPPFYLSSLRPIYSHSLIFLSTKANINKLK